MDKIDGGNQQIYHKRLKVLQHDFVINPTKTIQSFIGSDANIVKYNVNNIYIDNYLIVDVDYTKLDFDILKIYYVMFKDCKLLNIKQSNTYICTIDGFNICVIINNKPDDENTWLAINIKPTIPTQRGETFYKYYGVIINTPFHSANSQIFNFNHDLSVLKSTDLTKLNTDIVLFNENVIQKSYDELNNMFTYKSTLQALTSQELIRINTLDEGVDKNKLYIIDIRDIKEPEHYKGFLACSQYRERPWDVLYINIPNYTITKTKLNYLKWFMLNDYNNYIEWLDKIK